jgi:hypothetical protein
MIAAVSKPKASLQELSQATVCPNCDIGPLSVFYEVPSVPVHSVILINTREAALNFPKGDISLGMCRKCGFVSNTTYQSALQSYSPDCEETQGYSATFQLFHKQLAARLIQRHNLFGKKIVEIGCGKGEFLSLLCEMGKNRGVGFDPAYVPERNPAKNSASVRFIQDFYSEKYSNIAADMICCKMTLEHIGQTNAFISGIRRSIGSRQTVVFVQVPDFTRILKDTAFWDIYYEHCSYFTPESLRYLFQRNGFAVLDLRREYDDQYLAIEAMPVEIKAEVDDAPVRSLYGSAVEFTAIVEGLVDSWSHRLDEYRRRGKRVVVWGSGSKAVAFLSSVRNSSTIDYAVDINPYRQSKFLPGSGHEIVAPAFLREYRPDAVIAMNAIYLKEIQQELDSLKVRSELVAV